MKNAFIKTLKNTLSTAKLPGLLAHDSMRPKLISGSGQNLARDFNKFHQASVLIVLYPEHNTLFFPLIERTADGGIHSGQIALPGGKINPGENSIECALRETTEELGIDCSHLDILGPLSATPITPSQFMVSPMVGYLDAKPHFNPCPQEVKNFFNVSLDELTDPKNIKTLSRMPHREALYDIPYFDFQGKMVWGATAMILYEFLSIIKSIIRPDA
ncbi:MAG: hypothetical protein A2381_16615 [Bdellovibrionales bacterium RIFOXYB1_FULL_37_110]|nr:MAG: hypothetical protein A2181_07620 [Bdellovibrionales bacterium RIFOXYA1_FULL_38_20]OFZ50021.1 MAG: hypothetical protein A2417_18450 [Bdellovibrionales bacterium RIFOXYC1_FULL_37_79]OFZ59927.1 MAG: hypothetical protein A2381_16615 [Bdellovibrionales bacterium RIFOXYB1_FULL_37_110]OFZ63898.1 MAG: hypothetical protein A2577_05805 [Bdellovibrionales bacterium RIFOXYD1_FULL_36_51]